MRMLDPRGARRAAPARRKYSIQTHRTKTGKTVTSVRPVWVMPASMRAFRCVLRYSNAAATRRASAWIGREGVVLLLHLEPVFLALRREFHGTAQEQLHERAVLGASAVQRLRGPCPASPASPGTARARQRAARRRRNGAARTRRRVGVADGGQIVAARAQVHVQLRDATAQRMRFSRSCVGDDCVGVRGVCDVCEKKRRRAGERWARVRGKRGRALGARRARNAEGRPGDAPGRGTGTRAAVGTRRGNAPVIVPDACAWVGRTCARKRARGLSDPREVRIVVWLSPLQHALSCRQVNSTGRHGRGLRR